MMLNIITPCSRPENLHEIAKTINVPTYRWIVVFDGPISENPPPEAECYSLVDPNSISGNAQRNFALDLVQGDGWIYFNDDDTVIHPELWDSIKDLDADLVSFKQILPSGELRLDGKRLMLNSIDSHNFAMKVSLLGDSRWNLKRYDADGLFIHECWLKSKNYKYIDKVLSVYNALRK